MPTEDLASLSIGALKAILFTNHVNAGLILEKGELVTKVRALVEDERRERDRQRALEEAEEADRIERQRVLLEQHKMAQREREERARAEQSRAGDGDGNDDMNVDDKSSGSSTAPPLPPKARATAADLERTGLCVICQDDEANIAIVDCGYVLPVIPQMFQGFNPVTDIWRCAGGAQIWSWLAPESVRSVGRGLLQSNASCAYSRHDTLSMPVVCTS